MVFLVDWLSSLCIIHPGVPKRVRWGQRLVSFFFQLERIRCITALLFDIREGVGGR